MKTVRLQIVVRGRVQGVYFRQSTRQKAEELGLTGWVANRGDGSVEIEVEGPEPAVRALATWARIGPPAAKVDEVIERAIDPTGAETIFVVRR
jgi:acylphosphatase